MNTDKTTDDWIIGLLDWWQTPLHPFIQPSSHPIIQLGLHPCPSAYSGVAATRLYAVSIRGLFIFSLC
jgi:hypothetical protein